MTTTALTLTQKAPVKTLQITRFDQLVEFLRECEWRYEQEKRAVEDLRLTRDGAYWAAQRLNDAQSLRFHAWRTTVLGGDQIEAVCSACFRREVMVQDLMTIRGELFWAGHSLDEVNAMSPADAAASYLALKRQTAVNGANATCSPAMVDQKKRAKRGRPRDTDPKADRRVSEAWESSRFSTHEELAVAIRMNVKDVKHALDRVRKRRSK